VQGDGEAVQAKLNACDPDLAAAQHISKSHFNSSKPQRAAKRAKFTCIKDQKRKDPALELLPWRQVPRRGNPQQCAVDLDARDRLRKLLHHRRHGVVFLGVSEKAHLKIHAITTRACAHTKRAHSLGPSLQQPEAKEDCTMLTNVGMAASPAGRRHAASVRRGAAL
jgi:hypothetical protein